MTLQNVFFTISFFLILSAPSVASNLVHSPMKTYTGPECGVQSYEKSARRECGVDYFGSRRDPVCGPESFNQGPDLACPGSDAGGRVVKPRVSFYFPNSTQVGISIDWSGVSGTTQGGEDLRNALAAQYPDYKSFAPQTQGDTWVKELGYWTCTLQATRNQQWSNASITCKAKQYLASCEKERLGVAQWRSCERAEFGEFFRSCDDPTRIATYNSCQLRKTAPETLAYIDATSSNINILSQQLATAQGNYILGSKQAKLASCLIARYETDILYEEIVQDLKNNFSAMFGLEYEPIQFDCEDTKEKIEYVYQGRSCSNLNSSDVSEKLANLTLTANERYFYELCQQKQTVDSLTDWFNFQIAEADLLLSDIVARSNPEITGKLSSFRASLKKVNSEDIKCENCRITKVEASKTTPTAPAVPPAAPTEQIDVVYDGEAYPFSAAQGWDITQSSIESSSLEPSSGQNHMRATLNNANYWAAAAYVVDGWAAKDYSTYKKIRFKAKTNKPVGVKLFFVSMDNNLESKHLEFQASTSYQSFEFDLNTALTSEYSLSQVQGIVIAVSQAGKASYLVDMDDIQLVKGSSQQDNPLKADLINSLGSKPLSFSDNFVQVGAKIADEKLAISIVRRMETVEYRLNFETLEIEVTSSKYMSAPELQKAGRNEALYTTLAQEFKNAISYFSVSSQQGKDLGAYLNSVL